MLIFEENLNESGTAKIKGFVYDDGADRPAIIICPGGGYMFLTPYEGYPVAMAYFSKGFHSFICEYPIRNEAVYPNPQIAVLKAIQYVKQHASEWGMNPDHVFVEGFSAGAHVAACAGTLYNDSQLCEMLGAKRDELKPKAMLLIYPCIGVDLPGYMRGVKRSNVLSCDELVTEETPPTFMITSFGDKFVSCDQSLNMAKALSNHNVPFELHCFEPGDHGVLNSDNRDQSEFTTRLIGFSTWFLTSIDWLRDRIDPEVGFGKNISTEGRIQEDYYRISMMEKV